MKIIYINLNNNGKAKALILQEISCDNFIGQIDVQQINSNFESSLCSIVK